MVAKLLVKEIRIQKNNLLLSIFFTLVLLALSDFNLVLTLTAVGYLLFFGSIQLEEKYKSAVLLNSLPLNRKTIVASKYLAIFMYTAAAFILVYAANTAASFVLPGIRQMSAWEILLGVVSLFIISSIQYLLSHLLEGVTLQFASVAVIALYGFGMLWLNSLQQTGQVFEDWGEWEKGAALLGIGLFIMYLSYRITLQIYRRKNVSH